MTRLNIGDLNMAISGVLSSYSEVNQAHLYRLTGLLSKESLLTAEWARRNRGISNRDIEDRLIRSFLWHLTTNLTPRLGSIRGGVANDITRDLLNAICDVSRQRLYEASQT